MSDSSSISFFEYHSLNEIKSPNLFVSFVVCLVCLIGIFFIVFFLPIEKRYTISFMNEESYYQTWVPISMADYFKNSDKLLVDGKCYSYKITFIHSEYLYQNDSVLVGFDFLLDSFFQEKFIYEGSILLSSDTLIELFIQKVQEVLYA